MTNARCFCSASKALIKIQDCYAVLDELERDIRLDLLDSMSAENVLYEKIVVLSDSIREFRFQAGKLVGKLSEFRSENSKFTCSGSLES